jgi:hypothetical protein
MLKSMNMHPMKRKTIDHKVRRSKRHNHSLHHTLIKHAVRHTKNHRRKYRTHKKHSSSALFLIIAIVALCVGALFWLNNEGMVSYGHAIAAAPGAGCECTGTGCTGLLPVSVGEFIVAKEIRGQKNSCSTTTRPGKAQESLNLLLIGERCVRDNQDPRKVLFTYNKGKTKIFQNYCINIHRTIAPESDTLGVIECEGKNVRIIEKKCVCKNSAC